MPHIHTTKEELQERVKELSCLYDVSSVLMHHEGDNQATLEKTSKILQQAWRFPKKAVVEIQLENFYANTDKLPEASVYQEAEISVLEKSYGFVRVHYPSAELSQKHFLAEEKKLLTKIAHELSIFYEKQIQKEQEEILRRSAQRNDRLAILGEITAGIAHELNTPLGNILGFAELIKEKTQNEQVKQDVGKIIKAAIFSREVVKKLMFFACEMPQNMRFVRIKPIVEQALALLKPNFQKAEVKAFFNFENEKLKAQLDPIQLTQVLFNLIINALYFSPKGSKIEINLFEKENFLFLEISDEGPGIKKEQKAKIFEPFFTTKPIGEGSGLGLSVVHGIVTSHKGQINIFDNKPKGSVFQIKLPVKM